MAFRICVTSVIERIPGFPECVELWPDGKVAESCGRRPRFTQQGEAGRQHLSRQIHPLEAWA